MNVSTCVLIVDDDRNDVFLLRRGFHRAGLMTDIVDVADGAFAREYLHGTPPYDDRERFPFPNLLLLDIKMPRLNGFDVLAWISGRPQLRDVPALILTSSPLAADRETALRLRAREFLIKPVEISGWVTLAQGLHQRWLSSNNGTERLWRGRGALPENSVELPTTRIADADVRGGLFG